MYFDVIFRLHGKNLRGRNRSLHFDALPERGQLHVDGGQCDSVPVRVSQGIRGRALSAQPQRVWVLAVRPWHLRRPRGWLQMLLPAGWVASSLIPISDTFFSALILRLALSQFQNQTNAQTRPGNIDSAKKNKICLRKFYSGAQMYKIKWIVLSVLRLHDFYASSTKPISHLVENTTESLQSRRLFIARRVWLHRVEADRRFH